MRRITRRHLMKMGAGAALALGTPRFLVGCGGDEGESAEPLVDAGADTATEESRSIVAAIPGDDLYSMTRDALDALGGIQKLVNGGETVFLKPNMFSLPWADTTNPFQSGECTKPEILLAVTEECLKAGAKEVIIGDASHLPAFGWEYAVTLDGSKDLQAEGERLSSKYDGKVTLACLDTDSPEMVEIPTDTYLEKIAISSLVANADRIISIPVMKTHIQAQLTLSLKNFMGVTALTRYAGARTDLSGSGGLLRLDTFDHSSPEAIAAFYLDIVAALKPDLAIVDASVGVEGNGPGTALSGSNTVDMKDRLGSWLILASTDLVAADATAARVMNHDVADMKQIVMAHEMGLGSMLEESIEIVGERLDNVLVDWAPAEPLPIPLPAAPEAT